MESWVGIAISAAAVIVVPVIAWASRRATREQRLLARMTQLGRAYRHMPDSAARVSFAEHLEQSMRDYNEWMDPDSRSARTLSLFAGGAYLVAALVAAVVVAVIPTVRAIEGLGPLIGAALGVVVSIASIFTSNGLSRRAESKRSQKRVETDEREAQARLEALRIRPDGGS